MGTRIRILTDASLHDRKYVAGEEAELADDARAQALIAAGVAEAVTASKPPETPETPTREQTPAAETTAVDTSTTEHPTIPPARRR